MVILVEVVATSHCGSDHLTIAVIIIVPVSGVIAINTAAGDGA